MSDPPSFACVRCWKLKKKCDKLFPRCGRCSLTQSSCFYSPQPPTCRAGPLQSRDIDGATLYSTSVERDDRKAAPMPFQIVFPNAVPPNIPRLTPPDSLLSTPTRNPNVVDGLTAPMYTAFNAVRDDMQRIGKLFLASFNLALPIVVEDQLLSHLTNLAEVPDQDICSLLLAVYLVTQTPVKISEATNELDSLYSVLKFFSSYSHSTNEPAIMTIQTGILIAVYEHGQELHDAAYLSIGACARMGHAMGLHKTLQQDPPCGGANRDLFELHRHVWWSIIIVERVLALGSLDRSRPFAIKHPELEDHLPSFFGQDLETLLPVGKATKNTSNPPEISFPLANPYARSAQATYLLSLALDHITKIHESSEARQSEAIYLDKTLQTVALSFLEQSSLDDQLPWGHSCGAYMICICALFEIHQYNLSVECGSGPGKFINNDFCRSSRLALQSFTRIAIHTARTNFDDLVAGAYHAPPYALHYFCASIIFLLRVGYEDGDKMLWVKELEDLNSYLCATRRKWRVAGRHLNAIKKTAAELYEGQALL